MYVSKAMLWSEILGTFTTASAAGRTPASAWQLWPSWRSLSNAKEQKNCWRAQSLARWSRHKARRSLAAAGDRFDKALAAWENTAWPYATRLETERGRLGSETAWLEQARTSREEFFARHPEVPSRLAELDRVIERAEENERQRTSELLKERGHARRLGPSQDLHRGYGLEM
jgi:hypothetical protein